MATNSVYKDITIRDRALCRTLISALENAQNKTSKNVYLKKQCEEVSGAKLRNLFGVK